MYLLGASVGLIIIGNISIIAVKQAAWQNGFLLVIIVAVFNACGRLLSGILLDKIGAKNTFRIVLLFQAVNMALFSAYSSVMMLGIGAALTGLCYGGLISAIPAATAGEFGKKNLGLSYGIISTAYGSAGVLGPIMSGRIVDFTGSFHYVYVTSVVILTAAAVIISRLKK
jgi:MFS family permease